MMEAANDAIKPSAFLSAEDVAILTGRRFKGQQIAELKVMGIPFWINAMGKPIVARAVVEGRKIAAADAPRERWQPKMMQGAR